MCKDYGFCYISIENIHFCFSRQLIWLHSNLKFSFSLASWLRGYLTHVQCVCVGVVSQSFEQNMYAEFVVVPLEYFPHLRAYVAVINTVLFVPSTNKTAGFYLKWLLSEGLLFPLWEICKCPKGRSRGVWWALFIVLPSPTEFWLLKCHLSWLFSYVFKQLLLLF